MTIDLRRLRPEDAQALADFYNDLSPATIRTFRPLGTSTTLDTCAEIAEKNVGEEDNFDLIAWHKNQVVGWSFIWRLSTDKPVFGLGVADAYHRQGLGSSLMDAVMSEARKRRLSQVYLSAVKDNDIAWQMYARRGFQQYTEELNEHDELVYRKMLWRIEDGVSNSQLSRSSSAKVDETQINADKR